MPDGVKDLLELCRRQGCEVTLTKKNHWRIKTPHGLVFLPSTPSDLRSLKNGRSHLRKYGIKL